MPSFLTVTSEPYEVSKEIVSADPRVASVIGKVDKATLKYWGGTDITSSTAHFVFDAVTAKGKFQVFIRLHNTKGWALENVGLISPMAQKT